MPASSFSIFLAFLSSIVAALGGFIFKLASSKLKIKTFYKNYNLYIGGILFFLAAFIYIIALKSGELNILYPITAFTYVWSTVLAKKYLKEKINPWKISGILLIIFGTAIIVN